MSYIKSLLNKLRGSECSLADLVSKVYPAKDRDFAKSFYGRWSDKKDLLVHLGDGYDQLSKDKFFASAWFHFIWPPIEESGWTIIGTHAEDEMGTVLVRQGSGNVCYKYDDAFIDLADSFPEFIRCLRAAGWIEE